MLFLISDTTVNYFPDMPKTRRNNFSLDFALQAHFLTLPGKTREDGMIFPAYK